jgi:hypothetical protein
MKRDDIIRMAREARLAEHTHPYELWSASDDGLERFANLVAAAERDGCAKVAEQIEREIFNAVGDPRVSEFKPKIAAAIRARGQG